MNTLLPPKRKWKEVFSLSLTTLLLAGIIISGWVPRECPLLRQVFSPCPSGTLRENVTAIQKEERRIPHQIMKNGLLEITAQARGTDQSQVTVRFAIYKKPVDHTITLAYAKDGVLVPISLVYHPFLDQLTLPRVAESENIVKSIYQQEGGVFERADDIRRNLPPKSSLVADNVIASAWKLSAQQYTPLESVDSPDAIRTLVTSFSPLTKDGEWYWFESELDLTTATNAENIITLVLSTSPQTQDDILVSSISLDYPDVNTNTNSASPL